MGLSDKKWFKFSCPKCGTTEIDYVLDHRSEWGPPSWGGIGPLKDFRFVERMSRVGGTARAGSV